LRIGDAAFFRIVDRLLSAGTSRTPRTQWSIDGVEWQRERHSYSGATHGFTIEVTTGVQARWTVRVVKEYWRDGRGESARDLQWAQVEAGNRADIVTWLKRQERGFE
jgi:GH25 family lysozyme M1 (1,4-beta-N-acetylmuramidase)